MNQIFKYLALALLIPTALSAQQKELPIIPAPVKCEVMDGYFKIDQNCSIQYPATNRDLASAANFLNHSIKRIAGFDLRQNQNTKNKINLILGQFKSLGDEGYILKVNKNGITIEANTRNGIVYGMQSVLQLLPAIRTNAALNIPYLKIEDYPRFAWRGMHLDVCRHFFGPEFIKGYIDLLAAYKLNRFHWHLTDDQGWRIEIKRYPQLTRIGAWRADYTDFVWGTEPQVKNTDTATYGGYYTQEQIKDMVKYAEERNITIIPEIEMPGHAAAAIAAYPQLCCSQTPQYPMAGGNYTNISSNFCAGNDSVFSFLENVLSEVMQLFPSTYIHIGGDEVDKTSWKNCSKCQARIWKEGLHNEEELQSYFIHRIEKFVNSKGRKIIGWDEILEGGLAPNAAVMSWRGEAGGIQAAKMNHAVVMTPGTPCYFDHYQAGPEGEPLAFGGFNSLQMVYNYEPIPASINAENQHDVLGAQANLWTEYITKPEQVEYMLLPRMPALAEVDWSPRETKNWEGFNRRLKSHFRKFDQRGIRYCAGNFTVKINPKFNNGKLSAQLSNEILDSKIYYTLDGSFPGIQSTLYQQPIQIDSSITLRAITVQNGIVKSQVPASQNFVFHKAIGKIVTYKFPVSPQYFADGPNTLTDGIKGTFAIGKYWHGFYEKDLIATIDLGNVETIQSITLGCLQKYRDWIFLPQSVKYEYSENGDMYTSIQTVENTMPITQAEIIYNFKTIFPAIKARFIRVTAKNNLCPPGHPGEGKPGWIFTDELEVR